MKNYQEHMKQGPKTEQIKPGERKLSPLELIKMRGGIAHPVRTPVGRAADSMLAVYRDRLTYTFILDKEVASIHFDKNRKEIFFKGHNIQNMQLTPAQVKALKDLGGVLMEDAQGKLLFNDYLATLGHLLADNNK